MSLVTTESSNLLQATTVATGALATPSTTVNGDVVVRSNVQATGTVHALANVACQQQLTSPPLLTGGVETVVGTGGAVVISTATLVTKVVTTDTGNRFTLAAGVMGQVKVIVCADKTNTADTALITPFGRLPGNKTTIRLNSVGDTVTLVFNGSQWSPLGVTGASILLLFSNDITQTVSTKLTNVNLSQANVFGYSYAIAEKVYLTQPNVTVTTAPFQLLITDAFNYTVSKNLDCGWCVYKNNTNNLTRSVFSFPFYYQLGAPEPTALKVERNGVYNTASTVIPSVTYNFTTTVTPGDYLQFSFGFQATTLYQDTGAVWRNNNGQIVLSASVTQRA